MLSLVFMLILSPQENIFGSNECIASCRSGIESRAKHECSAELNAYTSSAFQGPFRSLSEFEKQIVVDDLNRSSDKCLANINYVSPKNEFLEKLLKECVATTCNIQESAGRSELSLLEDEKDQGGQEVVCSDTPILKNNNCVVQCIDGNFQYVDRNKCGGNGGGSEAAPTPKPMCEVNGVTIAGVEASSQDCKEYQSGYDYVSKSGDQFVAGGSINDYSQPIQQCSTQKDNATICCGDPYSCVGGGEPGSNKGASILGGLLQGGNKMIAGGGASITAACETLKNIGRTATAINVAMTQTCSDYAKKCDQSCKNLLEPLNNMNDFYSKETSCLLYKKAGHSNSGVILRLFGDQNGRVYIDNCAMKTKISRSYQEVQSLSAGCNSAKQNITKIANDAIGTQTISEFANKCKDVSSNENQFAQDPSAPFNGDCTNPAHSSNPICVQCRLDPSAQQCAGINLGGSPTQANNSNSGLIEEESDNDDLMGFNSLGTSNASDANPGLGDPQAIAPNGNQGLASSGAGGGGGGGGLGQDNIQALGTDPASQGGAAGGGYDTNILGNASGGGGYSVSSMGYGSGGGYNPRITTDVYENTPPTGIMKDGFDLKEYLPGGKAYKKKSRLPAGYIQLPDGEVIGPKHGNIFQMMHERYAYYESLGKFWPANYSKEKIECIKKSGILNNPPYSNQWTGDNLHKPTPIPNPPQCRHFADHDPNKPDPTQIYLKAETKKEMTSRTPQSLVASYKNKSLHEIYHTLTKRKDSLTKAQYSALYKLYKDKYSEYNKTKK